MIKGTKFKNFIDEFCEELNRLRADPTSYVPALGERLNCMTKGVLKLGGGIKVKTVEGEAGITEAMEFLGKVSPTSQQVKFNPALCMLSQVYANEGNLETFIEQCGLNDVDYFSYSEVSKDNCLGDFDRPADIIVSLIVDDANKMKTNRETLFSETLTNIGLVFDSN